MNSSDNARVSNSSAASFAASLSNAGFAQFFLQHPELASADVTNELGGDGTAIVERHAMVAPLPDLRPGNLGCCNVFHEVEHRDRTGPT